MGLEQRLPVLPLAGEDGAIVAERPLIRGCISEGPDRETAIRNILEAILLCLENQPEESWRQPSGYELFEVSVSR